MPIFKGEKNKPETPTLTHPPLLEVIFELRWEIQTDQRTGRMRDPSYPMMYGRLYERLKKEFPIVEDLPSTQAHPEATPYIPRHRMKKEQNGYPLIQVGPGIVTLNHSQGYSWESYRTFCLELIESICEFFPKDETPLNFIKGELRYVNGVELGTENPLSFLSEKLHTAIKIDSDLFKKLPIGKVPNALGLSLAFPLEKPLGTLLLNVNLGQFQEKPAYLFQTLVQSFGELLPEPRDFNRWLEEAHKAAQGSFQVLCKGDLMEKFSR